MGRVNPCNDRAGAFADGDLQSASFDGAPHSASPGLRASARARIDVRALVGSNAESAGFGGGGAVLRASRSPPGR